MDQWLDSLSEDWPSQPPSQHDSSSILQENGSAKSNRSQSRIPRRTVSTVSTVSSINEKEPVRRLSMNKHITVDSALKEKTYSSLNAAWKPRTNGRVMPKSQDAALLPSKTRNPSPTLTPSMPASTVAFKASPTKAVHETPEWKRRIVQGKVGPGDQTDMFGPIGLQSVFRPPLTASRPAQQQQQRVLQTNVPAKSGIPPCYPDHKPCAPQSGLDEPMGSPLEPSEKREIAEEEEQDASVLVHSDKQVKTSIEGAADDEGRQSADFDANSAIQSTAPSPSKPITRPFGNSRDGSGLDLSASINFSPVLVSKSHTIRGKIDYAAIEDGMDSLDLKMEDLRVTQRRESRSRSKTSDNHCKDMGTRSMSFRKSQINEITSQSLPEDLSVGTDAFAANGGFVSIHRGGYSNEGSFKELPLSPSSSSLIDGPNGDFTRASSQALPSPRHSQRKHTRHPTPPRTPRKDDEERPRSSGSPLKLFDKYDTFTNNRLARHISRFEETLAQQGTPEGVLGNDLQPSSPSPGPKVSRKPNGTNQRDDSNGSRRVRSFGSGELNELDFDASGRTRAGSSLPHFQHDDDAVQPSANRRRGKKASNGSRGPSGANLKRSLQALHPEDAQYLEESVVQSGQHPPEVLYTAHGKRLPNSPEKGAARKRRRTLCSSEERKRATLNARPAQPVATFAVPIPAANGRKRKDARYDSENQAADPKTLAMRQILRPRNPTPNQSDSSTRQARLATSKHPHTGNTKTDSGIVKDLQKGSLPEVDPPTQIVAGALATIALNTVQDMETGSRKASVTTSDFFNEAQQIMALIRAEKRPRSSHNSAETSNVGPSIIPEESFLADSTKDDLTRPPSREGGSFRRMQVPAQQDTRIVSHLRRFEDKDDLGLALPSSGKSLRFSNCDIASVASPARTRDGEQDDNIESDPPNIRIRAGITDDQQQERPPVETRKADHKMEKDVDKVESHDSSGSSAEKSVPTGSSRSSANMKKIAPQSVAHLLSDQMADMFFDKERQVWVKRKLSADVEGCGAEGHAASEGTEEDLFGDIPDLSVDEMVELKRVKDVVSSANTMSLYGSTNSKSNRPIIPAPQRDGTCPSESKLDGRPCTADGKTIDPANNSSAPSKYTNFAWSGPTAGTRATSYGDDVWPDKKTYRHQTALPMLPAGPLSPEVEHEFSILEGRGDRDSAPRDKQHRQPRVVTVAFSSPLIQSPYQPEDDWDQDEQSRLEDSPSRRVSQLQVLAKRSNTSTFSRLQRRSTRRPSMGNSSFIARPMSRLDEQDELSLVHYSEQRPRTSTDLARLTPLPPSRNWIVPSATGQRSNGDFELSPLPEFTVHQIDRPLDSEEGAMLEQCRPRQVSNGLSLTAQELIKHLTDLEPYEPYWYYIQVIVLRDRGLTSLHMLDEFCGRIQELDVSRNRIRELDGVPSTVRSLNIRDNCLSELTSWHTLLHLQYLDVSGNKVRSLKGFQGLLHLRSLKADDNEIDSLAGVERLDGLLSLRLRNNCLSVVDFERANL